ncbi:hypothetical protein D9M71_493320 [compost metagenome]
MGHAHVHGGVVLHEVAGRALDLASVFDDEHALAGELDDHLVDDRVDQGGLAGAGATDH